MKWTFGDVLLKVSGDNWQIEGGRRSIHRIYGTLDLLSELLIEWRIKAEMQ